MLSKPAVSSALKTLPDALMSGSKLPGLSEGDSPADQFVDLLQKLVSGRTQVSPTTTDLRIDTKPAEQPKERVDAARDSREESPKEQTEVEGGETLEQNSKESDVNTQAAAAAVATKAPVEQKSEKLEKREGAETEVADGNNEGTLEQHAAPLKAEKNDNAQVMTEQVKGKQIDAIKQLVSTPTDGNKPVSAVQQVAQAEPQVTPATMAQNLVETQVNAAQKSVQVATKEIDSAPVDESEKVLLPANPELSEPTKMATPNAPMVSAVVASAKLPAENLIAAATVRQTQLSDSLQVGRTSILEKALQEISSDRSPLPTVSLLGEKAKLSNAKESGKAGLTSQQEKIIVQIQKLIDNAAKLRDGTSLTVKIEPEELGQVLVRVTQRGDQLFARVVPENPEVEHTVRMGASEIVAHLMAAGFKTDNIHISIGRDASETSLFSPRPESGQNGSSLNPQQEKTGEGARHGFSNLLAGGSQSNDVATGENQVVDGGWVA